MRRQHVTKLVTGNGLLLCCCSSSEPWARTRYGTWRIRRPRRPAGVRYKADFYIAEWTLIHDGDKTAADSGLRRAIEECPLDFVETWMAKAKLASATNKAQ